MLFNEPKLLKSRAVVGYSDSRVRFSALQRAEIAEITPLVICQAPVSSFSALQRAEIAEIERGAPQSDAVLRFQCSSTSRNC